MQKMVVMRCAVCGMMWRNNSANFNWINYLYIITKNNVFYIWNVLFVLVNKDKHIYSYLQK